MSPYNGTLYKRWGKGGTPQLFTSNADVAWNNNFYWYGSNSIGYAVQVVHVPNRCPLQSEQTGEDLRMFVAIKGGQTAATTNVEDTTFTLFLVDYAYTAQGKVASIDSGTLTGTDRYSTIECKGSGFYEIEVPRSYWNNGGAAFSPVPTITVSFNAEYCKDLMRARCGDPAANSGNDIFKCANTITGITAGTGSGQIPTGNDYSLFPLGGRSHATMYMFQNSATRLEWYAPRLLVTRDMSYRPASYVKYTDAALGYNNETFNISKVNYKLSFGSEIVKLSLIKDQSLRSGLISAFLSSNDFDPSIDVGHNIVPPPATSPGLDIDGCNPWAPIGDGDLSDRPINNQNNRPTSRDDDDSYGKEPGDMSGMRTSLGTGRRADRKGDSMNFGRPSYLGQESQGTTPTKQTPCVIDSIRGNGIEGVDGYTFPGVGNTSDNSDAAKTVVEFSTTVTRGVVGKGLIIEALANTGTGGIKEVSLEIRCGGTTTTHTKALHGGLANKRVILFEGAVAGSSTIGNTIVVKITREAGTGNDTASYDSLRLNGFKITQQKSVASADISTANLFEPY
jgi:hypothetical protein